MKFKLRTFLLPVVFALSIASAQTSSVGVVTNIDAAAATLTLKTDAGTEVLVTMLPNVGYRRVAPGESDLSKAAAIALTDISRGDRVLARGQKKDQSVAASLIVVMSRDDLAKKQEAERADWKARGVAGVVSAIGPDSLTIPLRTASGGKPLLIATLPNTVIRVYAPDSVKFADAKPGKWSDIKVGDQVRARGAKTPDGSKLMAEEIVTGTFKTMAAVITAVDVAEGRIRVNNLDSKKPMVVRVTGDSVLKRLQPQVAQTIAARVHPAPAAGRGGTPAEGTAPDTQQLLESSPGISVADLKAGDAIVVSSTVGAAADQITAITLYAGVERILTKPGTQEMALGSWSIDFGN